MNAYIARQPILNRERENVGYELFYRNASGKSTYGNNGDAATRRVLTDALTLFDFQELTRGRAYINFTYGLLFDDFVLRADPEKIVVQVMSGVRINQDAEEKLRALRQAGYFLVLKNYIGQPYLHNYLNLFHVIRVNFKDTNSAFQRDVRYNHGAPDTIFMADCLETDDDFYKAFRLKYDLSQGYFCGKPELMAIPVPTLQETSYGEILMLLYEARTRFDMQWDVECAKVIKNHLLLSYLFLREMKAFLPPSEGERARQEDIKDMAHTARLMGPPGLRHWLWLVYMRYNNITDDYDLPRRAYLRGRFMEELARESDLGLDVDSGNVFLLGVLSMIEQIAGESPAYLLRGLPLLESDENREAYSLLLRYVRAYERGDSRVILPDIRVSLDKRQVDIKYRMCVEETDAAIWRMDTPI